MLDDVLVQLAHELADAVVIADPIGTVTFWNTAATRLFGWPAAEAIGQRLDLIIPERLRDRHWAGYREVMNSGETGYGMTLLEVPALHRDGRPLSIAFTVTLLVRPGETRPYAIAALIRDDTERWRAMRDLRAKLERRGEDQQLGGLSSPCGATSEPESARHGLVDQPVTSKSDGRGSLADADDSVAETDGRRTVGVDRYGAAGPSSEARVAQQHGERRHVREPE